MDVTLLGMVTEVNPLQPEKAYSPIDVTPSPIITSLMDFKPPNHPVPTLGHNMVTEVNPLQSEKAFFPIDVTLLGIVNEVNPLQPEKA